MSSSTESRDPQVTSTTSFSIAAWSAAILMNCALQLPSLVLYWRRRHLEPIVHRFPDIVFVLGVVSSLNSLGICFVVLLGDQIPVGPCNIFFAIMTNVVIDSYAMIATKLFYTFEINRQKNSVHNSLFRRAEEIPLVLSQQSPLKLELNFRKLKRHAFMASAQFTNIAIVAKAMFMFVYLVVFVSMNPKLWTQTIQEAQLEIQTTGSGAGGTMLTLIGVGVLPDILWLLIIAVRIKIVLDAFGIKKMLSSVGKVYAINVLINFTTSGWLRKYYLHITDFPLLISQIFNWCTFSLVILSPVRESFKQNGIRASSFGVGTRAGPSGMNEETITFVAFLRWPDGFQAFHDHLNTEFALENLMFWRDVEDLREQHERCEAAGSHRGAAVGDSIISHLVNAIYDTYLAPYSPLEINLPDDQMKRLRKTFAQEGTGGRSWKIRDMASNKKIYPAGDHNNMLERVVSCSNDVDIHVFDEAMSSIIHLMKSDSLRRFLRDPAKRSVFETFLQVRDEMRMMKSVQETMVSDVRSQRPANTSSQRAMAATDEETSKSVIPHSRHTQK